jgi:hypothetical protein
VGISDGRRSSTGELWRQEGLAGGWGDVEGEMVNTLSLMKEVSAGKLAVWGNFDSANTADSLVFGS